MIARSTEPTWSCYSSWWDWWRPIYLGVAQKPGLLTPWCRRAAGGEITQTVQPGRRPPEKVSGTHRGGANPTDRRCRRPTGATNTAPTVRSRTTPATALTNPPVAVRAPNGMLPRPRHLQWSRCSHGAGRRPTALPARRWQTVALGRTLARPNRRFKTTSGCSSTGPRLAPTVPSSSKTAVARACRAAGPAARAASSDQLEVAAGMGVGGVPGGGAQCSPKSMIEVSTTS